MVSTNLDGFSLVNHGRFAKFTNVSPTKVFLHTVLIRQVIHYASLQVIHFSIFSYIPWMIFTYSFLFSYKPSRNHLGRVCRKTSFSLAMAIAGFCKNHAGSCILLQDGFYWEMSFKYIFSLALST